MQQQQKFEFEESPSKKGNCPQCKKPNCFRHYKIISREFGICDHKNKCEFHNNPNKLDNETKKELYKILGNEIEVSTKIADKEKAILYPSSEQLKVLESFKSVFHDFCINVLQIPQTHLQRWNVGTDNTGNTAFVMQTLTGKHLNIKFMNYAISKDGKNCKRDKKVNFSLVAKDKTKEQYKTCLFGEHLLTDKTICLVESEKTAVIASFFYPEFEWLATGGSNGLTVEKVQLLKDKSVYYLADNDKAGKENSSIKKLELYNIKFKIVQFEIAKESEDLADIIIRGERPEIKPIEVVATMGQQQETNIVATTQQSQKTTYQIENETFEEFNFFERDNRYYTKIQLKHSTKDQRISNFKMNIISKINDGTDNMPIMLELIRHDGRTSIFETTSLDIHNSSKFNALIFGGGYNFTGNNYVYKNILETLHNDKNVSTYITSLGQHLKQNFYSFSNGILTTDGNFIKCDDLGFIDFNNEKFYIPSAKLGNEENEKFTDDLKFKFRDGVLTLDLFLEKVYSIYSINGIIGLCFTIANIHRDIIFQETKCFPFMFLYGGKGSGKSTYINFFMNFFGEPQPEITENSTEKALERKFSQINNNSQYIKEFSSTFEDKTTNILKNAYDGTGYSRAQATQDNKTKTITVRSGIWIDGNFFPTKDSALFSRLIFMIWQPKFTDNSKKDIQELQDLLNKGNSLIFIEIYSMRKFYKEHFSSKYREAIVEIKTLCKSKKIHFSEREITHIAMMAVVFKLSIKLDENAYTTFLEFLIKGTQTQMQINESIDDVNKFFEALETLENTARIKEQYYYKWGDKIEDYQFIHINFNACYLEYAKYLRETGVKQIISSEELKQKLTFVVSKEYYSETKKEIYSNEKWGEKQGRSLVFKVEKGTFNLIK